MNQKRFWNLGIFSLVMVMGFLGCSQKDETPVTTTGGGNNDNNNTTTTSTGVLTGKFTNYDNAALAGFTVLCSSLGSSTTTQATTDLTGTYTFSSVPAGSLSVIYQWNYQLYFGWGATMGTSVTAGQTTTLNVQVYRVSSINNPNVYPGAPSPTLSNTLLVAQSFQAATSVIRAVNIGFGLNYQGVMVQIRSDSGGAPSGVVLASTTITRDSFLGDVGIFSSALNVIVGTTYWIVLPGPGGAGKAPQEFTTTNNYTNGVAKFSSDQGSTWAYDPGFGTLSSLDMRFVVMY